MSRQCYIRYSTKLKGDAMEKKKKTKGINLLKTEDTSEVETVSEKCSRIIDLLYEVIGLLGDKHGSKRKSIKSRRL